MYCMDAKNALLAPFPTALFLIRFSRQRIIRLQSWKKGANLSDHGLFVDFNSTKTTLNKGIVMVKYTIDSAFVYLNYTFQ